LVWTSLYSSWCWSRTSRDNCIISVWVWRKLNRCTISLHAFSSTGRQRITTVPWPRPPRPCPAPAPHPTSSPPSHPRSQLLPHQCYCSAMTMNSSNLACSRKRETNLQVFICIFIQKNDFHLMSCIFGHTLLISPMKALSNFFQMLFVR